LPVPLHAKAGKKGRLNRGHENNTVINQEQTGTSVPKNGINRLNDGASDKPNPGKPKKR
jgi:hypothetical protein